MVGTADAPTTDKPGATGDPYVDTLVGLGWNPAWAQGYRHEVQRESSGDPTAVSPTGRYRGAIQLSPERQALFRTWSRGKEVTDASPQEVAEFSNWEVHNTEPGTWRALQGVTDPTQAARIIKDDYLRPLGTNVDDANNAARGLGVSPGGIDPALNVGPAGLLAANQLGIQAYQEKTAAEAPILKGLQERLANDQKDYDQKAKDYTPYQPTPAPQQPTNDPFRGFASAGAIFAALAAGFTHTPAITAMNGMAGAINAAKKGDWDQYEVNYKTWKDASEQALQKHKLLADDMKAALERMQTDVAAGTAMAHAAGAAADDKIALATLMAGNLDHYGQLIISRDAAAQNWQLNQVKIEAQNDVWLAGKQVQSDQAALAVAQRSGDQTKIAAAQQALTESQQRQYDAGQRWATLQAPASVAAMGKPGTDTYRYNTIKAALLAQDPDLANDPIGLDAKVKEKLNATKPQTAAGAAERDVQTLSADDFQTKFGHKPDPSNNDDKVKLARLQMDRRAGVKGIIADEDADLVAQEIIHGNAAAGGGYGRNPASAAKIAAAVRVAAAKAGMSGADIDNAVAQFQGIVSANRALGTRQVGIDIPAAELQYLGPIAKDLSHQIDRTQYPSINAMELEAKKQNGDPTVVRFMAAINELAYADAKFHNPGKSPTDDDLREARARINESWSKGQVDAAIDQLTISVQTGQKAIGDVRQELSVPGATPAPGGGAGDPASAAPVTEVKSKDEFDKLPSGAHYRKPGDGPGYRTKP